MSLINAKQQFHPSVAGTFEAEPTLIGLAGPNRLPTRLRDVLQALLDLCTCELELGILDTLSEFEKQLVRLADKATIHQQNEYFDSVHELKRGRSDVVPRFLQSIENSLARLGEDTTPLVSTRSFKWATHSLALTDEVHMDESLVLSDIATKVELRVREPMFALGRRFGALADSPPLAAEVMPLGPRSIVEALRYGAAELDLPNEHRLVLYRCFERVVMNHIGSLYVVLNNCLIERNILPDLHNLTTGSGTPVAFPRSATKPAVLPVNGNGGARSTPLSSGTQPISMPTRLAARGDFLGSLRHLAAEYRRTDTYTATGEDLQAALAELQVASIAESVPQLRAVDEIKRQILMRLLARCAHGLRPRISEDDSNAIDATARLFDFLSRHARPNGVANRILVKLQLPILRAAIKDKSFFSDETHSARRLLSEFVDVAQFWIDEKGAEANILLVYKLQQLTDRIASKYQGDALVFTATREELSQHVAALVRRGEAAERHHTNAAAGRENIERTRELAASAIGERIARTKPTEFLRALLECAWTDALTIALLREGPGSSCYQRRLEIVDLLLLSGPGETLSPDVRVEIEAGLAQAGMHDDDIRAITKRLFASADSDQQEDLLSQTELAIKLKARRGANSKAALDARAFANGCAGVASGERESLMEMAWASIRDTVGNFSGSTKVSSNPTAHGADKTDHQLTEQRQPERMLLLVDDEVSILRALTRVLRTDGYRILCATSAAEAKELLEQHEVQVIIADQRMPRVSGTRFLTEAKAMRPNTVRILLSGYSDAASVMDAINRGAVYKFLTKPWNDDDIRLQVREAFMTSDLQLNYVH